MYLSPAKGRVAVAFLEALLPGRTPEEREAFRSAREKVPETINDIFDADRFDDPKLAKAMPLILTILQWIPVICFWLIWKPLPLTRLSIADRQRLYGKLEHSRLYGLRGLYMVSKVTMGLVLFHHEEAWTPVGYDGEGVYPRARAAGQAS